MGHVFFLVHLPVPPKQFIFQFRRFKTLFCLYLTTNLSLFFHFRLLICGRDNLRNLTKLVKIKKLFFLFFHTEISINGVVTKSYFGRHVYVLSVLPKKFSWKIDKLFCPQPHLFEFCLILGILKKLHNFTTPVEISDGRKSKIDS